MNFVESNENASLTASGFGSGNVNDGTVTINSLLKFDYNLPEPSLMLMGADMFEVIENFGAAEAENDPDALLYKVSEIIGERATIEYAKRTEEDYIPIASFAPKIAGTMVFSKVMMEWSPEYNSWFSRDKLGLSHVARADLNASLDGLLKSKDLLKKAPS